MIQIVGLGIITTILALILREQKPMFAFLLTTFAGTIIILFVAGKITAVLELIQRLADQSNINQTLLKTVLKIIGIAYIAEFGAQIVRDAGQEAIASKIELAGKIIIMFMAIPIITVIIETVMKLLPT